jgi:hypothetical protein
VVPAAIVLFLQYARVPSFALDAVRDGLADDDDEARRQLDTAFAVSSAYS